MNPQDIVIVAARRTPIGAFQGALAPLSAPELSAAATRACLADSGLAADEVDHAIIGCVLQAGLGQAPARQAALAGGLTQATDCLTVNKVCGSAMKAATIGYDMLRAGAARYVLAGGMESMSNAPYLLPKARAGYRMGHQQVLDHMFFDGLQNPYDGQMMGYFAEQTARHYGFTREQQDAFAIASVERALAATASGAFEAEIAPVTVASRRGESVVRQDEEPARCDIGRIPVLRPAFAKGGTVTAASSSSIADGAASLLLTTAAEANARQLPVLARIAGYSTHSQAPEWFTTAPVGALRKLQERLGWSAGDVDLYEINEAFACVTMAAMRELDIDHARINVNGGACALGHPIGATGARIIVTLLHALQDRGGRRGIAALCIGGGEALAIALDLNDLPNSATAP
ncbi:MAG: acetyl-CoA C-acyltransferase [Gammaproteobacteria bacterium]|nr:MAG: acetyl-CoA C-acyltransferase [Gammaproteobacteria bacterium]